MVRTPLRELEFWIDHSRWHKCLPKYIEVGPGLYRDILASEIMPELNYRSQFDKSIPFFGVLVKQNVELEEFDYRGVF